LRRAEGLQPIAQTRLASTGWLLCAIIPGVLAVFAASRFDWGLPFLDGPDPSWTEVNGWLLAIAASVALTAFAHACLSLSVRDGLLMLGFGLGVSSAAEYTGLRWQMPFGFRYVYDPALQPLILGQVPAVIPLMWFALAYTPVVFLRRMSVRPEGRLDARRLLAKTGLCSLFLVAMDLFLDPLGVSGGTWTWPDGGSYFGIPLMNFVGWFIVGVAIFLPYFLLAEEDGEQRMAAAARLDAAFAALSVSLTGLCLLACPVRLGSWIPTLLAGAVIVPCWGYWLVVAPATSPCRPAGRWIRWGGRLEPVAEDAEPRER